MVILWNYGRYYPPPISFLVRKLGLRDLVRFTQLVTIAEGTWTRVCGTPKMRNSTHDNALITWPLMLPWETITIDRRPLTWLLSQRRTITAPTWQALGEHSVSDLLLWFLSAEVCWLPLTFLLNLWPWPYLILAQNWNLKEFGKAMSAAWEDTNTNSSYTQAGRTGERLVQRNYTGCKHLQPVETPCFNSHRLGLCTGQIHLEKQPPFSMRFGLEMCTNNLIKKRM